MLFFEKSSWKKQNPLGFAQKTLNLNIKKNDNRGKKSKFLKFKASPCKEFRGNKEKYI
jgi:hypothetical protein